MTDTGPVFIVEAVIKEPWLTSSGSEKIYLRPGIGAAGRVIVDQDTVMRMILKKLDFINESFDEKALSEEKNETAQVFIAITIYFFAFPFNASGGRAVRRVGKASLVPRQG